MSQLFALTFLAGIGLIGWGVYTDKTAASTPQALDSLPLYVLGGIIAVIGLIGLVVAGLF